MILTILAVLLLLGGAGLNHWSSRAQSAACTSHLRQIGVLINLYAQENNGFMPRTDQNANTTAWFQALYPLIGITNKATGQGIFHCPGRRPPETPTGHSYAMEFSAGVGGGMAVPSVKLAHLTHHNGGVPLANGLRWLVMDAGWHMIRAGNLTSANPRTAVRLRHQQRANVLMPDFSVRTLSKTEINQELYLFRQAPIP